MDFGIRDGDRKTVSRQYGHRRIPSVARLLVIVSAFAAVAVSADDDDGPAERGIAVALVAGRPQISFDGVSAADFGIETAVVENMVFGRQPANLAQTLPLAPLLAAKLRLEALASQRDRVLEQLALERAALQRAEKLQRDGVVVSFASLQDVRARVAALETELVANREAARALRSETALEWGAALTEFAFAELAEAPADTHLVVITTATPLALERSPEVILSSRFVALERAEVEFIGAAVQSHGFNGATYYCLARHPALRSGMRLTASIAEQDGGRAGVLVPRSAVVWYGGAPWVYRSNGDETYVRIELAAPEDAGPDLFVRGGVDAGDRIVVRGAQSLLAEEFRWSIPDEGDDE